MNRGPFRKLWNLAVGIAITWIFRERCCKVSLRVLMPKNCVQCLYPRKRGG